MAEIPKSIKATLYIDGKPAESSMKNLETVTRRLQRELKQLEVGTDAWNKKMKEVQTHQRALRNLNAEINETAGLFGFLKTEIGKFGALAAGYLGFEFITDQFRGIIMGNAELSDSFADVRKTTGLSEEGVRRLAQEFKKIDTRSSQSQLLGLAEVAGKLGIAGERDVLGFVRAADKISVALGKDLGNSEDAINSIGKLVELFKVKEAYGLEDSMIRTGSAINALGAAGTASEGYLVEFTKRMGGIAPQANFSIESILGLAATMDELGQPVEASATAIGQFITGIGKDLPGFAKVAGMSVKDFSKLLQEDGNAALLEVLKNLKSTGQGVAGLAEKMGLVGEDGARAVGALGALSNNLDLLVTRQRLANEEFAKGTSLQNEYNIKNENFAAVLDKTGKSMKSMTSNAVLTDFLKNLVISFKDLVDWGNKNISLIVNLAKFVMVGAVAWGTYKAAVLLSTVAVDAFAFRIVLARTASIAFAGAQALLTGNTLRAQAAMRALNLTASVNPFVAVATALMALVTAVALFSKTTSEAQRVQTELNNIEADAAKNRNDEIQRIKDLKSVIDSETTSRQQKLMAVEQLRKIMPDALQNLKDEEVLTNLGTVAINKYIKALEEKTLAEAAQSKIRKLQERNIEIENGATNDTSIWQDVKAFASSGNINQFKEKRNTYGKQNAAGELEENNRLIKSIQEKYGSSMVKNLLTVDDVVSGGTSTGGLSDTGKKSKAKENAEKLSAELKKIQQDLYLSTLSKYDAEIAATTEKYNKLRKLANGNKNALLEIDKTEAKEKALILEKHKKEAFAESQKKINERLAIEERIYQLDFDPKEKEQAEVDKTFEDLINSADAAGLDSTGLYQKWTDAKLAIEDAYNKKSLEKTLEAEVKRKEMMLDVAREVSSAAFTIMSNSRQADLDASINYLNSKRESELSDKNLTEKQKEAINRKYDAEIKEGKKKAWKAEQRAAIAQALINGALAMTKVSAQTGVLTFAFSPIVAAVTAAQIAVIAAQKAPQYATGGFSNEDPAGYVDRETLFARSATGRPFIAGEAGREWIAPNWMLQNPRTANIIGMLETARQEKRAFALGGYSGGSTPEVFQQQPAYDFQRLEGIVNNLVDTVNQVDRKEVVFVYQKFEEDTAKIAQVRLEAGM